MSTHWRQHENKILTSDGLGTDLRQIMHGQQPKAPLSPHNTQHLHAVKAPSHPPPEHCNITACTNMAKGRKEGGKEGAYRAAPLRSARREREQTPGQRGMRQHQCGTVPELASQGQGAFLLGNSGLGPLGCSSPSFSSSPMLTHGHL